MVLFIIPIAGCIPPFFDGGMTATDCFEDTVKYTTFTIDAGEPGGFVESEENELSLEDLTDGDEQNITQQAYYSMVFTSRADGVELTSLAFIVQASDACVISFSVTYGEKLLASEQVSLLKNSVKTVYFPSIDVTLEKEEKLYITVKNPLEVGAVPFRTDSYIFIGQEV